MVGRSARRPSGPGADAADPQARVGLGRVKNDGEPGERPAIVRPDRGPREQQPSRQGPTKTPAEKETPGGEESAGGFHVENVYCGWAGGIAAAAAVTSKSMDFKTAPASSLISTFQAPGHTVLRLQVRQGEPFTLRAMSLISLPSTE
jgi:hypothetical protein